MTDRNEEIERMEKLLKYDFFEWQLPIVEKIVELELEKRDLERR